jgi:hypothetical protein
MAAVITLCVVACVKQYDINRLAKTDYSPLLAAPLVKSSMTISDLLKHDKDGMLQVGSDNLLTLVYKGRLLTLQASDFISFPNQTYPFSTPSLASGVVTALNALPLGSTYSIPIPGQSITFNTNGSADIDSIVFKKPCTLDYSISSVFKHPSVVKLDIPYAKKNGVAFSQSINLPYTGTLPSTIKGSIDLNGYTFNMTMGGTSKNKFDLNITLVVTKSSNNFLITDNATLNVGFTNPKFQKLFGNVKQQLISPGVDTVDISLFKNSVPGGGNFTLANPTVKIFITNSYGVPIDASFTKLQGYSSGTNLYNINVAAVSKLNPWHFPYPTLAQLGKAVSDSVILSNANTGGSSTVPGSIGYVLSKQPKKLIYQLSAKTNPNGAPVPPNTNFTFDSSRVTLDLELDLPLHGTASGFTLQDTTSFSLSKENSNQQGEIEYFLFRLNATNGLPVEVGAQIYFTDSLSPAQPHHVLDSLIAPYKALLPAAGVDAAGKVNAPSLSTTDIRYDKTRLEKIKKAKHLIISGKLSTTNNGTTNIKFYSDYRLDIRLGLMVKIKTKI